VVSPVPLVLQESRPSAPINYSIKNFRKSLSSNNTLEKCL
jgi:hypothetical protein